MRLAIVAAATLLLATIPPTPSDERERAIDVCAAMPPSRVDSILARNEIDVKVTRAGGRSGACTYQFSDRSVSLMIDVGDAGSIAEAAAALKVLRAPFATARDLSGIGDGAFLYDEGQYGVITVKYSSGSFYGQVNLRASEPWREAAVIELARGWVSVGLAAAREPARAATVARAPERAAPTPSTRSAGTPPRQAAPSRPAASRATVAVPDSAKRARRLPPLQPLRWADPDSAARARGLVRVDRPAQSPPGDPSMVALQLLRSMVGADTALSAEARAALEQQARGLATWKRDDERRFRDSLARVTPTRAEEILPRSQPSPRRRPSGPSTAEAREYFFLAVPRARPFSVPQWYRRTSNKTIDSAPAGSGITGSGSASATYFKEPWQSGEEQRDEAVATQSSGNASFIQREFSSRSVAVALCPDANGIVKGHGTVQRGFEIRVQVGARPYVERVDVKGTFDILARVNDDAAIQSYDVNLSLDVEHGTTSTGGDLPRNDHTAVEMETVGIDPGINWKAPGSHDEGFNAMWTPSEGTLYASDVSLPEAELQFASIVRSDAASLAQSYLESNMLGWWWGDCEEIRVAESPRKTHLRFGESAPFALEAYHYQDAAPATLPIEAFASGKQPQGQNGEVAPGQSNESPASFTFTAPSRQEAPSWQSSEVSARSTSRRGRTLGVQDPPVFRKLDESALYLVEMHGTVTTAMDGVVFDVTYEGYVASEKDDPDALKFTSGSYSGHVHDVNRMYTICKVISDERRPLRGAVDLENSGAGIMPAMPPQSKAPRFIATFNGLDFDGGKTLGTLTNFPGTELSKQGDGQSTITVSREWGKGCENKPNPATITVETRVIRIAPLVQR